jgi:hypothetical protein
VEAKVRRVGELTDGKKLLKTLRRARPQLPASGPGVIIASIPKSWTDQPDSASVISAAIQTFFRETARVNHVVLIWYSVVQQQTGRAFATRIRQYDNDRMRHPFFCRPIINPLSVTAIDDAATFCPSYW